jgi:CHAT domain-containing protein/Tfp pilus assembly protein PilF
MKHLRRFLLTGLLGLLFSLYLTTVRAENPVLGSAESAYQQGRFAQAAQILQQALEGEFPAPSPLEKARIFSLLALTQQKLGQWAEAQSSLNSSLAILPSVANSPGKTQVQAQILNNQGSLELAQGQAQTALQTWQNAEKLYQQTGDKLGSVGAQMNQAQAWETLGFYRRSCDTVLHALAINPPQCEQLNPTTWQVIDQQPPAVALMAWRNLGNFLRLLGKFPEAEQALQKSLRLATEINSPLEKGLAFLGLGHTRQALAMRAQALKESEKAAEFQEQAWTDYAQAAQFAEESGNGGNLLLLLARLEQFNLRPDVRLLAPLEEALAAVPPSRTSIYARVSFAQTLANLNPFAPERSIAHLETARQQAQSLGDRQAESHALGMLGQVSQSRSLLEQALLLAQAENAPEIAYRWQWQLARIYRQQGETEAALRSYQAAFNTLGILRADLVALAQDVQFSFREEVEPIYRDYADLLLDNPSQENLQQARLVIEALQIAELDNYFQDACSTVQKGGIEGIDSQAAILYTMILPRRLAVILSLPNGEILSQTTAIAQENLERQLTTLRGFLQEPDRLVAVDPLARQLHELIIAPFQARLAANPQIKTLVFVLDGVLQNLPMGILYNGQKYLAEDYAIAVTPSLQLLGPHRPSRNFNALIAGVSEQQVVQGIPFSALDNVKQEWQSLQTLLPHDKLFNTDFTKINLQKRLTDSSYAIIHLATHGQFSSDPAQTYLLLWDQFLNVKDWDTLFQLRNRQQSGLIDLLVLSACETARGDRRAALGLAGVAVRTGARSTLATLWQVNDEATAFFMAKFYEILRHNPQLTKAQVLQQAQLELKQESDRDWQVPYFWASYVLVGNWL